MVSLSLTISVSRRPSTDVPHEPQVFTPSIRNYTASIPSSRAHSRCPSYPISISQSSRFEFSHPVQKQENGNGNGSLERLLTPSSKKRVSVVQIENGRLKRRVISMETGGNGNGNEIERKKSYGIGGAGNIRRPSDVIYPVRMNADGTRRRSSVWSSISTSAPGTSPDGKRNSFLGFFRRGSVAQDVVENGAWDDDVGPTDRA